MKQIGLFDESNHLKKLSVLRDLLEKLNCVIDWRMFEGTLNKVFAKEQKGGQCEIFSVNTGLLR